MLKLINFLTLLAFVNTITYFPDVVIDPGMVSDQAIITDVFHPYEDMDFDGDTLLENILNDLLDLPIHDDGHDPDLYDKLFNLLSHSLEPAVKYLNSLFDTLKFAILSEKTETVEVSTKIFCLPGYYLFLFRLQPF